jgi:DNA invertase Pin-like site-specific DNA recombinase
MLRIGYVRLRDPGAREDAARLKSEGCHVVRIEEPGGDGQALGAILDFIGPGDELAVIRISHLGATPHSLLATLRRLEDRGATLAALEPPLNSGGAAGLALRAALEAVVELEQDLAPRRRQVAPAHEIIALQRAGVGPVEIARRLGVSRMTVWRKLKAMETEGA